MYRSPKRFVLPSDYAIEKLSENRLSCK
ncbi:hypothetical protein EG68_10415 [Paragonimus skrjabini miyazakii]|uniref:Uncharacterized protein n=1 Tax=Paragonimus skrjabini miyazakii TaxID=59628 RepID=A0A8S9YKM0_9TREM|nr:hypothetical protein EG68_10415 [Paragonimus skrjabini miyazakii]